jgi:hypothetical protein
MAALLEMVTTVRQAACHAEVCAGLENVKL